MNNNPDYAFNPNLALEDNPFAEISSLISRKFNSVSLTDESLIELVHLYYQVQNIRDSISNFESDFNIYSSYFYLVEESITNIFQDHNARSTTGTWAISQEGVGQAMSAALLCLVDIDKCPTVSNLWRFAGLDPKHTKWNPLVKNIAWKIGMSFQSISSKDTFYGNIFNSDLTRRKDLNEKGNYAFSEDPTNEKISDARLEAQARRYATKIFLSHWHHVRYRELNGTDPSSLFVSSTKYISPPNFPY